MTNLEKNEIIQLVEVEIENLGSANKVATKCGVSPAMISNVRTGKHELIAIEMWLKIGNALGYNNNNDWQIAETLDFKKVYTLCDDIKNESLFRILSSRAGIGKSAALKTYAKINAGNSVFYIRCREWSKRDFLTELCTSLGIETGNYHISIDKLGQKVSEFFLQRSHLKPILIIDEADKLKDAALRWFIHLYNDNENKMGCLLAGTENLEKRIKDGVRLKRQGYDEIESRFRRTYVKLNGSREVDIKLICELNGITDRETQKKIFETCSPVSTLIQNQTIRVITDLRNVQGRIASELRTKQNLQYA